jgi:curved DNA-binding protein CbpA
LAKPADVSFKDFYQILQLQPDADSGLVDQAYWYLARVYNETPGSMARVNLDDLNEAYSVLRSPPLREAYDKIRDGILGQGAPPTLPRAATPRPPLHMMTRQQSQKRVSPVSVVPARKRRWLNLASLVPKLPRLPKRSSKAPSQAEPSPRDLASLYQATEAARARWRASAEPGAPYHGPGLETPPDDNREVS